MYTVWKPGSSIKHPALEIDVECICRGFRKSRGKVVFSNRRRLVRERRAYHETWLKTDISSNE